MALGSSVYSTLLYSAHCGRTSLPYAIRDAAAPLCRTDYRLSVSHSALTFGRRIGSPVALPNQTPHTTCVQVP